MVVHVSDVKKYPALQRAPHTHPVTARFNHPGIVLADVPKHPLVVGNDRVLHGCHVPESVGLVVYEIDLIWQQALVPAWTS